MARISKRLMTLSLSGWIALSHGSFAFAKAGEKVMVLPRTTVEQQIDTVFDEGIVTEQEVQNQLGYTEEQKAFYKTFGYDIDQDEKDIKANNMRVVDGNLMIDTLEQFDFRVQTQQNIFKANGIELTSSSKVGDLLLKFSAVFIDEEVLMILKQRNRVTSDLSYGETMRTMYTLIAPKYEEYAEKNEKNYFPSLLPLVSGFKSRQVLAFIEEMFQKAYVSSEDKNSISGSLVSYIPEFAKLMSFLNGNIKLPYYFYELDPSGLIILKHYISIMTWADQRTGAISFSDLPNYNADENLVNMAMINLEPYINIVEGKTKTK